MALVFKIKFQDMLRRWLVAEDFNAKTFFLTFSQLEDKIRDLFHILPTTSLVITYIDKDNDVVTLGDEQDLVDACIIQQLNPLRLEVNEKPSLQEQTTESCTSFIDDSNPALKVFYPYITTVEHQDVMKASNQDIAHLKHRTEILSQKSRTQAGNVANDGLRSVLPNVPPLLPNHGINNLKCHRGVQCDGCGMNPIEGSRYKSKKFSDFDLCFSCFDVMGTATDFEKLDHPETTPTCSQGQFSFSKKGVGFQPRTVKDRLLQAVSRPMHTHTSRLPYVPECPFSGQALELYSQNELNKKLDARFIEDVTILDETELEPCTRFIKTWRMENNGTLPWPKGTQLAHMAGTALSSTEVVKLELPEGGLPCEQKVDISVDLTAPNVVGRYVSHWRLMSPFGQWFGHTVWVVIQVKFQPGQSNSEGNHLQETEDTSTDKESLSTPDTLNVNVNSFVALSEGVQKSFLLNAETEIELDGYSIVEKPVENNRVVGIDEGTDEPYLGTHLRLLETMGFGDLDSNIFWLKKNNTNMQSTLQDIITCAGWEDQIRNLEEMGFKDQVTNLHLLQKNGGSIKLVVRDLVKIENQAQGQETLEANRTEA